MPARTITAKGQITIPRSIREQLRLRRGDRLEFSVSEDGRLVGEPIREHDVRSLCGILGHLAPEAPVSIEEMRRAARRRAARKATEAS